MICCRQQPIRWRDSDEQTAHGSSRTSMGNLIHEAAIDTGPALTSSKDVNVATLPAATKSYLSLWRLSFKPRLPRRPMLPQVHGA